MFKRIYNKYIKSKFLVKLILAYSIIIFIAILITGNLITSNFLTKMEQEEIRNQEKVLSKLKIFTDRKYDKIKDIMFQLYVSKVAPDNKTIGEMFALSEQRSLNMKEKQTIRSYLRGITRLDKDIKDIVLINDDKQEYYYSSSKQSRSLSLGYDFSQDEIIKMIERSDVSIKVFSNKSPDYILGEASPVISIAGNIFNPDNFPELKIVGKYLINLSTDIFLRAYNEYSGKTKGNLLIVNGEGRVLFDNENKYMGKIYPYFEKIKHQNRHEMTLEEPSIVNWFKLQSSEISIIMVTPRNEIIRPLKQLKNRIFIIIFVCIAIALILTLLVSKAFASRIKGLAQCMKEVQTGNFDIKYNSKSSDEIGQLGKTFNQMCKKISQYIDKVYKAELETKKAELSSLRSQINPHFLYNTLEMIRMKAHSNQDEEVADMLTTLGKLFRWNVKDKDNIVTIETEIDYIKHYLELQKMRDPEKLEIEIRVEQKVRRLGIPKLLLQPIVENSLYHGLFAKDGKGRIAIQAYQKVEENDILYVNIKDNGVGMEAKQFQDLIEELDKSAAEKDDYYIGLSNVHQRIKLFFGEEYGLKIKSRKDKGTEVCVIIPALTKMEMEDYV